MLYVIDIVSLVFMAINLGLMIKKISENKDVAYVFASLGWLTAILAQIRIIIR